MTTAEALAEKDRALSELEIAKRRVIDAGLDVLREWAAKGRPFSANSCRDALREVGVVRAVGWEPSSDRRTHYKPVAVYEGTGRAAPVTPPPTREAPEPADAVLFEIGGA